MPGRCRVVAGKKRSFWGEALLRSLAAGASTPAWANHCVRRTSRPKDRLDKGQRGPIHRSCVASSQEMVDFVRGRLGARFDLRKMFGEYAIYAEGKVVALLCDDRVYVKVHEATAPLAGAELAPSYPGAKPHYVIEEGMLADPALGKLLLGLAHALPEPKTLRRKKG